MSQCRRRRPGTRLLQAAIAVLSLLLAAAPALAASRQAQERAARKACLNGDYAKGVAILSELFVETREPTYLFNQGRCFEQNRRCEDAAARFEEYLRVTSPNLSPEDKTVAEKHLSDCQEKLAKERGTSPTQPAPQPLLSPPPAAPPTPAPSPEPSPELSTPVATASTPQPAPDQRRTGLLAAGIITGAVGVVGVVGGVILNLKANSMVNDMETQIGGYSPAKGNDQKTYQTLAWVGYGVGAACVVAGAVLIGFGAKSSAGSSTAVALVPAVGPGQIGAMLTGGF